MGRRDSMPAELGDMRGADISFAETVARSPTAHTCTTHLVTDARQGPRVEAALRWRGVR